MLVDDHELVRHAVAQALGAPDISVVAEARSGEEAIPLALDVRPEVLLLDVHLPGISGIDVVRELAGQLPDCKIVMLTVSATKMQVMEAVASGRYASIGLNDAITAGDRRHAEKALRRFGILGLRDRTLAEMSYGQARRVLFARAWAREPRLALLDEPFAGLDRSTRADLAQRLNEWLDDGGSCLIATHHRDEWPAHTTHVLELDHGRAVTCHALGDT